MDFNKNSVTSISNSAGPIAPVGDCRSDLPLASANSDMIRWSRVLPSHTLDAARSY